MQKHLTPEDRLDILRAADTRRKWSSLDERRICTRCNKFITGRQIEIRRDQRGRFLLHCPTPDCASTVQDWFYQGSGVAQHQPLSGRSEVSLLTRIAGARLGVGITGVLSWAFSPAPGRGEHSFEG